ncbi:class I SAM-dependent methyltransferase [Diaminobutyricimonas sp. LJ205]|uniref:class I SAM-dependent methyltransferase n=1 Tax=Diaminobutyricimonas sp. LJ205 TaxID=2683590 RepID=UPI0012F4AF82|nr:class I SAM-dependent methyltransferase [Diaminobutyricimonas sp. LJ205]
MADYDPRLVELYDFDNPDGPDHDFYRELAAQLDAQSIIDIGCGTGLLTVTLAGPGRSVLGTDPSRRMLDYARSRPQAGRVRWLEGDASAIDIRDADYAVMTGNVAQHIDNNTWAATLANVHRALRTGGVLAFESRNPAVLAWEEWRAEPVSTRQTPLGPLQEWMEVSDLHPDGVVNLTAHNVFENTGEHVIEELALVFRDRAAIEADLVIAGFIVEAVWGGWAKTPLKQSDPIMVFQARKE